VVKQPNKPNEDLSVGGTGILPVKAAPVDVRQGAYLPHWTRAGSIYAVTFRLADSLPLVVLETWRLERMKLLDLTLRESGSVNRDEEVRSSELYSTRVEAYLDAGHGKCWLGNTKVAESVLDSLKYFDGQRYHLHAWCLMPNHVHVVLEPIGEATLPKILHTWKSHSAKKANALLDRKGCFWQPEYYDHLIRDEADYVHALEYVMLNPLKAGLKDWLWVGKKALL
jgi:REP element-mobilizing transposase RayT